MTLTPITAAVGPPDLDALSEGRLQPRSRAGARLSIIAPAFNEEQVLSLFFERLEPVLQACVPDYEIICVNDGSRDGTLALLLAHRRRNPRIKVVDLSRNFGKEVALSAGLDFATGDMVVPIDVDLQDPPELIERFVQRWEEGYDVAYGVRERRDHDTWLKKATANAFYGLFRSLSDVKLPPAGDYRLMSREVVDVLRALPERNRFMKGLFAWVGFHQVGEPYARPERAAGATSWRYWRLWNFALDGLTSFTTLPLRVWTYVGAGAALGAVLYALSLVLRTLLVGRDVPGYASLMVVLLMSFAFQMLAVGILGEYIGRIYNEVKQRPLYVVRSRHGLEPSRRREARAA